MLVHGGSVRHITPFILFWPLSNFESNRSLQFNRGILRPMYIIGLTGNIATGKSTVMHILAELGAQAIDADLVAHEVMRPGGSAYLKLIGAFGDTIVSSDGAIDR